MSCALSKLKKIVINMGVGEAINDKKHLTSAVSDLVYFRTKTHNNKMLGNRLPVFKIREGWPY